MITAGFRRNRIQIVQKPICTKPRLQWQFTRRDNYIRYTDIAIIAALMCDRVTQAYLESL